MGDCPGDTEHSSCRKIWGCASLDDQLLTSPAPAPEDAALLLQRPARRRGHRAEQGRTLIRKFDLSAKDLHCIAPLRLPSNRSSKNSRVIHREPAIVKVPLCKSFVKLQAPGPPVSPRAFQHFRREKIPHVNACEDHECIQPEGMYTRLPPETPNVSDL